MVAKNTDERLCKWCKILLYGAVANFLLLFFTATMLMGGSAGNGRVEGGRFFLGDHGKYVEVSANAFWAMQVYERFTISFFAIGFVAALIGIFLPGCMRRAGWWSR